MTPIEIPRSNEEVWKPGGEVALTLEVEKWMDTFVGIRQFRSLHSEPYIGGQDHYLITNSWHSHNPKTGTRIYFSNPSHAVLFKLTFL